MATETVERRVAHRRSLKVTATATLAGVAAGVASPLVAARATDTAVLVAPLVALFGGLLVMRVLGVDVADFSTKDQLYVGFMTFTMWFIAWAILLTTDASLF